MCRPFIGYWSKLSASSRQVVAQWPASGQEAHVWRLMGFNLTGRGPHAADPIFLNIFQVYFFVISFGSIFGQFGGPEKNVKSDQFAPRVIYKQQHPLIKC